MKKETTKIKVPLELAKAKAVFNFHVEKKHYGKLLETELLRRQALIARTIRNENDLVRLTTNFEKNLRNILGFNRFRRLENFTKKIENTNLID